MNTQGPTVQQVIVLNYARDVWAEVVIHGECITQGDVRRLVRFLDSTVEIMAPDTPGETTPAPETTPEPLVRRVINGNAAVDPDFLDQRGQRQCEECGAVKDLDAFTVGRGGRSHRCMECKERSPKPPMALERGRG